MGIDVSRLKPKPDIINKGTTSMDLTYTGIVDSADENDAVLELFIDPSASVFILVDGSRFKSVKWDQTFPLKPNELNHSVQLELTNNVDPPQSCSLRLEVTSANGFKSACNSHLIIH
jgi:hypothetical protein